MHEPPFKQGLLLHMASSISEINYRRRRNNNKITKTKLVIKEEICCVQLFNPIQPGRGGTQPCWLWAFITIIIFLEETSQSVVTFTKIYLTTVWNKLYWRDMLFPWRQDFDSRISFYLKVQTLHVPSFFYVFIDYFSISLLVSIVLAPVWVVFRQIQDGGCDSMT